MDDRKVLLTLTDFICWAFLTVYFQMSPQRVFTQILGWLANPFELFWIKISLMDDRKVLLTLGTGTVARAQNHSDFLLKEWNVT